MCEDSLLDRLLPEIAWATAKIANREVIGLCGIVSYTYARGTIGRRERDTLREAIYRYTTATGCGYVAMHLLYEGTRDDLWFSRRAMLWQRWAIDLVKQAQQEIYG